MNNSINLSPDQMQRAFELWWKTIGDFAREFPESQQEAVVEMCAPSVSYCG